MTNFIYLEGYFSQEIEEFEPTSKTLNGVAFTLKVYRGTAGKEKRRKYDLIRCKAYASIARTILDNAPLFKGNHVSVVGVLRSHTLENGAIALHVVVESIHPNGSILDLKYYSLAKKQKDWDEPQGSEDSALQEEKVEGGLPL